MNFKDETVVITGAASGFGAAAARRFAEAGARIVAADINVDGLAETVGAISSSGGEATSVETDVTRGDSVQAMIDAAVARFGTVDVLINNAGAGQPLVNLHEMTEEQYDRIYDLNAKSVYFGVRSVVPVMIENGGGVIINTASIGAKNPRPKSTLYNSAKGAVIVMTRGLAVELARYRIRVNCVCPLAAETGFFKSVIGTDVLSDDMRDALVAQVPLRRLTKPDDVANAMLYLASEEGGFLTGVSLDIDGGKSI